MTVGRVILVHPDDINLADAKALAAEHDTTVVGSPYVRRGQIYFASLPDPFAQGDPA